MTETLDNSSAELETFSLAQWAEVLSRQGEVEPLHPEVMAKALESFGANFEIDAEARKSLTKSTNRGRKEGMLAVWGARYPKLKKFARQYVVEYEAETGKKLPAIKPSGRKTSGMMLFFGEITAYAAGAMAYAELKLYLSTRVFNGKAFAEGRKDDRKKILVPTADRPIRVASIPPEFPVAAVNFLKTLA